jgi:hypothetical protein
MTQKIFLLYFSVVQQKSGELAKEKEDGQPSGPGKDVAAKSTEGNKKGEPGKWSITGGC